MLKFDMFRNFLLFETMVSEELSLQFSIQIQFGLF